MCAAWYFSHIPATWMNIIKFITKKCLIYKDIKQPISIAMNYKENIFYVASYVHNPIMKISASGKFTLTSSILTPWYYHILVSGIKSLFVESDKLKVRSDINRWTEYSLAVDQQTGNVYAAYSSVHFRQISPAGNWEKKLSTKRIFPRKNKNNK